MLFASSFSMLSFFVISLISSSSIELNFSYCNPFNFITAHPSNFLNNLLFFFPILKSNFSTLFSSSSLYSVDLLILNFVKNVTKSKRQSFNSLPFKFFSKIPTTTLYKVFFSIKYSTKVFVLFKSSILLLTEKLFFITLLNISIHAFFIDQFALCNPSIIFIIISS